MMNRVWCREAVAQVQIDVPETLDVADRAGFYDATGAFRDMIVTHLFQVAAEVAMEPPVSFDQGSVRDEKVKVLKAVCPLGPTDVDGALYRCQKRRGSGERLRDAWCDR